jgi:hypothetical protein
MVESAPQTDHEDRPAAAAPAIEMHGVMVRRHGRDGRPLRLLDEFGWSARTVGSLEPAVT